ncbi:MAG: glycoside hydrolase family 31 protein [Bryobacteraceae bacterium]
MLPLRSIGLALVLAAPAAGATWARNGNVVSRPAAGSKVEFEWIAPGSFRFSRCAGASCVERRPRPDEVAFTFEESPSGDAAFRTAYLVVTWRSGLVTVNAARGGESLLSELPREGALFRRRSPPDERLYGLGPRDSAPLDLRGQSIAATHPLLISSAGYAQYFSLPVSTRFHLGTTPPGVVRVDGPGPQLEYFFHYGPSPKEMLEDHLEIAGPIGPISKTHVTVLPERFLPRYVHRVPELTAAATIRYLAHAAMSGILVPAVPPGNLPSVIAELMPITTGLPAPGRAEFLPYLFTYLEEARDRAVPMFRPMALQYPKDPAAAAAIDQFMIGDEILVAGSERTYLPQGIWTDLSANTNHQGRQFVATKPGDRFAHNGTILPLAENGVIVLHYFPRLGAEFFISEPGEEEVTQVHAGPAGDLLRLQIESKVGRDYRWVVHNVSEPLRADPNMPFHYEPKRRELSIPMKAAAGSDRIVNVTLREPL